jgi:O-antigen ligase
MKNKVFIHLCFLVPFVITLLNLQVLVTYLLSTTLAQIIAYVNLGLILLGTVLMLKHKDELSKTSRLWIIFFLMYFVFAIMAGAIHNNPSSILLSTIPFFYVLGFYYYLSVSDHRVLFEKVALMAFAISCFICIYWKSINFDLDKLAGVNIFIIDRASGVYGDANQMALVSIISFVFLYKNFKPENKFLKIIRLILLAVVAYCLFITFSNTGFMVFVISLVMLNYKFFSGIRIIFGIILLPVFYVVLLNLNHITANLNLVGQQRDKINNIVNMLSFNFDKVDDSGRSQLVNELLYYIFKNPLFGNGLDFANSHHAHNTVLGVWADAGIFVLLFFLFMLGKYFLRAISSPPHVRYFVLPVLIALCIFMLSLQSIINQPYLMALFVYLGYLLDFNPKKKSEELKELEEEVST